MDLSVTGLSTIRVVAERRSFTAAAAALGYTQSAVSRQVAAVERELGTQVFYRVRGGVKLTSSGTAVLRQIVIALDALDQAQRELELVAPEVRRVRLGAFAAAGAALIPRSVATLRRMHPDVELSTREGPTPALVRAVRSGSLQFAVITARPPYRSPDQEDPPLVEHELFESRLALAVSASGQFGGRRFVAADEVARAPWIATSSGADEPQLGVWPGLPGRPRVRYWARDWTTKLGLVAEGAGVTTLPKELFPELPAGVELIRIDGVPDEIRRVMIVHRRDAASRTVEDVVGAFAVVAGELGTAQRRLLNGPPGRS